jgi:small acid-soluble spore protein A (major alpha-type SASP)
MANTFGGTNQTFGTQAGGVQQQFPTQTQTAAQGGDGSSNNQILVTQARSALEQLKQQTAAELGIQNYAQQYKGDLPSRVNGSVGGFMVKKMIALAESQLSGGTGATTIR